MQAEEQAPINPMADSQNEYVASLTKREEINSATKSIKEGISDTYNYMLDQNKRFTAGGISLNDFDTNIRDKFVDLATFIGKYNANIGISLITKQKNLGTFALIQYTKELYNDPSVALSLETNLTRMGNRHMRLSTYQEEINNYIDQSKKLMDSLPTKLRAIVDKLKDEQTRLYKEVKVLYKPPNQVLNQSIIEVTEANVSGFGNLGFPELRQKIDNGAIPLARQRWFAITGLTRAFFVKLPSILNGLPHDICVFSADKGNGNENITAKTKYMHIKQLGKRVYNFKYKAWWGPMVKFFSDLESFNGTRSVCLMLRVADASDTVANVLTSGAPITLYCLNSNAQYVAYMKKLIEIRTHNFKTKRTAQRFMRNYMSKFLNTDKQIIQEIGQYTNIAVK